MARLEDLTRGAQVHGLRPDGPAAIVDVQWHGSTCVELTYKDASARPHTELVFRDREPTLDLVAAGQVWSFDADGPSTHIRPFLRKYRGLTNFTRNDDQGWKAVRARMAAHTWSKGNREGGILSQEAEKEYCLSVR